MTTGVAAVRKAASFKEMILRMRKFRVSAFPVIDDAGPVLPGGPTGVEVAVRNGVVTLAGAPELSADTGLMQLAVRLTWDVDGVVDVINKAGPAPAMLAGKPRTGR